LEAIFIEWLFSQGVTAATLPRISLDAAAAVLLAALLLTAAARWVWRVVELEGSGRALKFGAGIASLSPIAGVLGAPASLVILASALGLTLASLALFDWRHAWLPDPVVLGLAGAGAAALVVGAVTGQAAWTTVVAQLLNGGIWLTMALMVVRFERGAQAGIGRHAFASGAALGPGDAKLIGALAIWVSPQAMALTLALTAGVLIAVACVRLGPAFLLSRPGSGAQSVSSVSGNGGGGSVSLTSQIGAPHTGEWRTDEYHARHGAASLPGPIFGRGYVPLCPILALAFWAVWLSAAGWQL